MHHINNMFYLYYLFYGKICIKSIKCVETYQNGGTVDKITYYEDKLNKLYNQINISTID